jgi:hypothetical protein
MRRFLGWHQDQTSQKQRTSGLRSLFRCPGRHTQRGAWSARIAGSLKLPANPTKSTNQTIRTNIVDLIAIIYYP